MRVSSSSLVLRELRRFATFPIAPGQRVQPGQPERRG
jgi:hypothetical protein